MKRPGNNNFLLPEAVAADLATKTGLRVKIQVVVDAGLADDRMVLRVRRQNAKEWTAITRNIPRLWQIMTLDEARAAFIDNIAAELRELHASS